MLIDKLVNGIHTGKKLSLISAPAGYGKTALILEFIKTAQLNSTWISLDDSDNDKSQFLSYLIAALKKVGVNIGPDTEKMTFDFSLASTPAPITGIINDIAGVSDRIVLILDDYHLISSSQIHNTVQFLLDHQPNNLHLIIITRENPPLSLLRLRVQGKITEIRMDDLHFTYGEAKEFYKNTLELELSERVLDILVSRTEGWAASSFPL